MPVKRVIVLQLTCEDDEGNAAPVAVDVLEEKAAIGRPSLVRDRALQLCDFILASSGGSVEGGTHAEITLAKLARRKGAVH
ncbi:MAG: hypothetical protein NVSMB64_26360 [Candidatus Velthaea sp.]